MRAKRRRARTTLVQLVRVNHGKDRLFAWVCPVCFHGVIDMKLDVCAAFGLRHMTRHVQRAIVTSTREADVG
jgi:hypothetical protein